MRARETASHAQPCGSMRVYAGVCGWAYVALCGLMRRAPGGGGRQKTMPSLDCCTCLEEKSLFLLRSLLFALRLQLEAFFGFRYNGCRRNRINVQHHSVALATVISYRHSSRQEGGEGRRFIDRTATVRSTPCRVAPISVSRCRVVSLVSEGCSGRRMRMGRRFVDKMETKTLGGPGRLTER